MNYQAWLPKGWVVSAGPCKSRMFSKGDYTVVYDGSWRVLVGGSAICNRDGRRRGWSNSILARKAAEHHMQMVDLLIHEEAA